MRLRVKATAMLVLLGMMIVLTFLSGGCSEQNPYETQEPTPFMVSKAEAGGNRIPYYMLPGHSEVEPVVALLESFVRIDLTQSSDKLDWEPLRHLASSQLRFPNSIYVEGYRTAKLTIRVEFVNIKQVTYYMAVGLAGSPLNSATASVDVVIRYIEADPDWLERSGVTLGQDATFHLELRLIKENDRWVVRSVNYAPKHPSFY